MPAHRYWALIRLANLADTFIGLRRYEEAQGAISQGIELGEEILGPDHPRLGLLYLNRGLTLVELGRYTDAERAYLRALEIYRAADLEATRLAVSTMGSLGRLYALQGRIGRARKLLKQAWAAAFQFPDTRAPQPPLTQGQQRVLLHRAFVEEAAGELRAAAALYRQLIAPYASTAARSMLQRRLLSDALLGLGRCLLGLGSPAEALPTLERASRVRHGDVERGAAIQFALAEALAQNHREPARAPTRSERAPRTAGYSRSLQGLAAAQARALAHKT